MKIRPSTVVAAASVAGLLGWLWSTAAEDGTPTASLSRATPEGSLQSRYGGSEVPCAVPLAWRLARVDPEFDLSREEAGVILEESVRLWEDATGKALFVRDPAEGFPVRIVYDERQEQLLERSQRQQDADRLALRLGRERELLTTRAETLMAERSAYQERASDLERRVAEHATAAAEWNRRGGAPAGRREELETVSAELRREEETLAAERLSLLEAQDSLARAQADLNRRVLEHRNLADEITADAPDAVEAGEYREAVTREDGRVVAVSREIRLYRFDGREDLERLAAHELGHALGLGHSDDPEGLMYPSALVDRPVPALAESDVALFLAVCG